MHFQIIAAWDSEVMDTSQVALLARYEAVRGGRPNYPEKLHQYQVCPNGGQFKYDTAHY